MAVTNDLVTDQRVHRSCSALKEAGYDVLLIGRRFKTSEPLNREYSTHRMSLVFNRSALFYAEYNLRLFWKLLWTRCDMVWANDTDTLLASYCAAKVKRVPLWVDAHELFTEVPELVGREKVKRVWEKIERRILPKVKYGSTVCDSVTQEYARRYGVELMVVRNFPIKRTRSVEKKHTEEKILLYQGAVNIGRGVDWMIEAMEWLEGYRFIVAGTGDEIAEMKRLAASRPWHDRIEFVGRLEPEKLFELTCQADLGISLLENLGLNYYYALPNRLADFVQAGVPVLATDFPEIRNIIETYRVGVLVENHSPEYLAEKVKKAISWWESLGIEEQHKRMDSAAKVLNWEQEKVKLVAEIDNIFNKKTF